MIVVDTNVISELMRGDPHPSVLAWVAAQPRALVSTRDTGGFAGCGLTLINPWEMS